MLRARRIAKKKEDLIRYFEKYFFLRFDTMLTTFLMANKRHRKCSALENITLPFYEHLMEINF